MIASPNGGEVWEADSIRDIIYTATDSVTSVSITLSLDAGMSWQIVAASVPASGTYSWLIPDVSSTACLVRVANASQTFPWIPEVFPWDVSDDVFTIVDVNHTPVAIAGTDQHVEANTIAGATITLDGTGSYDPDSDPIVSIWTNSFGMVFGTNRECRTESWNSRYCARSNGWRCISNG